MKHSKCRNLLNNTCESYYWLGYLASDGSFKLDAASKISRISLRVNDKESVEAFKKFLEVDNKISQVGACYKINVMDRSTCQTLIDKYKVSNKKTYNPMIVRNLTEDKFVSYLIGFIDGDGSIKLQTKRSTPKISIKCHFSWLNEMLYWHSQLEQFTGEIIAPPKINNQGYCSWSIASLIVIKYVKLKSRKLQLPCLKRKWDVINLRIINSSNIRELQRRYLRSEIPRLKLKGLKTKEICDILKINQTRYYYYKEYLN